jgi:protein SCO1/2
LTLDEFLPLGPHPRRHREQPMKTYQTFWLVVLPAALLVAGCGGGGEGTSRSGGDKLYDVRGKVVAVDAAKPAVTIDHEDIPGLMKAMQMEFGVEDPRLLEGIKVGDQVKGRLKKSESGYVLTQLERRTGQ